jgi:hypothetical protein
MLLLLLCPGDLVMRPVMLAENSMPLSGVCTMEQQERLSSTNDDLDGWIAHCRMHYCPLLMTERSDPGHRN